MDGDEHEPSADAESVDRGVQPGLRPRTPRRPRPPGAAGPAVEHGGNVVRWPGRAVEAEALDHRPPVGVDLDDQDVAAGLAGDDGDEQPDRTAADDHDAFSPAQLTAPDVVHGHGGRLDQRGVPQRDLAGSRTRIRAGTVQEPCIAPGESMPTKSSRWQM